MKRFSGLLISLVVKKGKIWPTKFFSPTRNLWLHYARYAVAAAVLVLAQMSPINRIIKQTVNFRFQF